MQFRYCKDAASCPKEDEPTWGALAEPSDEPEAEPCCQGACAGSGLEKYYSIAKSIFGKPHCGECCMDPKKYNLSAVGPWCQYACAGRGLAVCWNMRCVSGKVLAF